MPSLYQFTVPTYIKFLNNFLLILDKAEQWAKQNGKTEQEIVNSRLIEDMWPFRGQVYEMVGTCLNLGTKLCGVPTTATAEVKGDTFADCREVVQRAVEYLKTIPADSTDGKEGIQINLNFGPGKVFEAVADQFVIEYAVPNFNFHYTTAYAILRSMGVNIGKMDYIKDVLTLVG